MSDARNPREALQTRTNTMIDPDAPRSPVSIKVDHPGPRDVEGPALDAGPDGYDLPESSAIGTRNGRRLLAGGQQFTASTAIPYGPFSILKTFRLDADGNAGTDQTLIVRGNGRTNNNNSDFSLSVENANGQVRFVIPNAARSGSTSLYVPVDILAGTDYRVMASYDGDVMRARVNDSAWVTATHGPLPSSVSDITRLGAENGGHASGLVGEMGDAVILSDALSDADADWYYNGGTGRTRAEIEARTWTPA